MNNEIKLPAQPPVKPSKYYTLTMSAEDASMLLMGDLEGWVIVEDEIVGQSRWETQHEVIVNNFVEDKFYSISYSRGSTEMQDNGYFGDYGTVKLTEVEPYESIKIVYKPKLKDEVNA